MRKKIDGENGEKVEKWKGGREEGKDEKNG